MAHATLLSVEKLAHGRNGAIDVASHIGGAGVSSTVALVWLDAGDTLSLRHLGTIQYDFGYAKTELSLTLL